MRVALTVVACAMALAACGSSGKPAATGCAAGCGVELARCMRAHGVSNFPDPPSSGRVQIPLGDAQSPAFRSAASACRRLLPNKGQPPPMTASERQAAVRFAECMRAHGEPDFPDPTAGASSSPGRTLVLPGMTFAIGPGLDPKSPAFQQAAHRCGIRFPSKPLPEAGA